MMTPYIQGYPNGSLILETTHLKTAQGRFGRCSMVYSGRLKENSMSDSGHGSASVFQDDVRYVGLGLFSDVGSD